MNSREIREQFLTFFRTKLHTIVPSAPLVIKNDPTLMFTNAGMNQFKDYFLGNKKPTATRVADTQKCLRVSGKHNDLEDVGLDTYHHTLFEMLGNWSFGDYFKKEAITWAWELLTEVYKLPKDRLYVTVFEGDVNEGLAFDKEAYDIWATLIEPTRILKGNKKDNFWEMGDQGPCGPCSEIHIDLRPTSEIDKIPGHLRVNQDDPQVIEIWNNVFIQYNRKADGTLELLPAKHVDTGMGFERLVRVIQGKSSNYDTDVFQPLIQHLEKESGIPYKTGDCTVKAGNTDEMPMVAMRVVADHVRAVAFAIADGQLPSNAKAGYVIRRILRRAIRYGYTYLHFKEPFVYKLVPILAQQFDGVFSELKMQEDFIATVIREEETSFLKTLENGLKILENTFKSAPNGVIDGKTVFELYDTYGFPVDLTSLIAREKGYRIDEAGFEAEMELQKKRSRNASAQETGDWILVNDSEKTEFVGYDCLECQSQVVKYRTIKTKDKVMYQVVLDKTPFYAESGGQVGDTGMLQWEDNQIHVIDTKKENDLIVHFVDRDLGIFEPLIGKNILARVNIQKRVFTQNNHSATHLLQSALREVLGNHVQQKGSYVSDQLLRFDFSHFSKMTDEEISRTERIVNDRIRKNILLDEKRNIPIQEALAMGATALFGEKYGDFVRVIAFDAPFSVELCGGTHVPATGNIGYFKIISESSVAAGVRRVEAVTAVAAEQYTDELRATVRRVSEILKNPKDILGSIESLIAEKSELLKKLERYELQSLQHVKSSLKTKVQSVEDIRFITEVVDVPHTEALKTLCFELRNETPNLFCTLGAVIENKPHLAVILSDELVQSKNWNASQIVRDLAAEIQGGGGGQPFFATAGGKHVEGLNRAIQKAKDFVKTVSV